MPKWNVVETIRTGPSKYRKMLEKRGKSPTILKDFLTSETEYKKILQKLNVKRSELNKLSAKFHELRGEEVKDHAKKLKEEIKQLEKSYDAAKSHYTEIMLKLPNTLEDEIPEGTTEDDNAPIKYFGTHRIWSNYLENFIDENDKLNLKRDYQEISWRLKGHTELLEEVLNKADTLQAAKIAGSRFYYIFDEIVWLDFALTLYAMDLMTKMGYTLVIPPFMVGQNVIRSAIDFETLKDMIYGIKNEDLFLIGTAEHPLLGMGMHKVIEEKDLPIKLAGWSVCFRKEAGAHGKDTKGIFRVHQFQKIEQFIFCYPDLKKARTYFKELVKNAEKLWQGLRLPYRLVNICGGELGDQAIIKYDIEVWFPAQRRYREVVSVSNCLDWQTFRGNIVFRNEKTGRMAHPYTLNGTAIPTSRAICAILENYQEEDGSVMIPKVLKKYLEPFQKAPKEKIRSPSF